MVVLQHPQPYHLSHQLVSAILYQISKTEIKEAHKYGCLLFFMKMKLRQEILEQWKDDSAVLQHTPTPEIPCAPFLFLLRFCPV